MNLIRRWVENKLRLPACMSDDREVWEMEPKGMMEYFQSSKHKLGESIAICGNALMPGLNVEIEVSWYGDDEKPYIAIFDDGDGMDAGTFVP